MKSIIISAFPGTGKTWCYREGNGLIDSPKGITYTIHDLDSTKFSRVWDNHGNKTDQRNLDFPDNYITAIKELADQENNIIFVSIHEEVRRALANSGFRFYIVTPTLDCHDIYIANYRRRGHDEEFISLMSENWKDWIKDIEKFSEGCNEAMHFMMDRNVYMSAALYFILDTPFDAKSVKVLKIMKMQKKSADSFGRGFNNKRRGNAVNHYSRLQGNRQNLVRKTL